LSVLSNKNQELAGFLKVRRGALKLRFAWLLEEERIILGFQEGVSAPLHFSLHFSTNVYNNCGNNNNSLQIFLRKPQ
jgi:hypothetical protein